MNVIEFDWVTGMCFGIEFPEQVSEDEEDESSDSYPMPWLVIHLGIIRIFVTKYNVEE